MGRRPLKYEECWRLNESTGCHEWVKGLDGRGYGAFYPVPRMQVRAHRYAYERSIGKIPDGLDVCHTCDVKRCVNPDHLFAGTHTDNMQDLRAKGYKRPKNKLRPAQIQEVRHLRLDQRMSLRGIAMMFNVAETTVRRAMKDVALG